MSFVGDLINSVTGADSAADGAERAANAQLQSTRESNALLEKLANQARQDNAPWRQAGQNALAKIAAGKFDLDPGYRFRQDEGEESINRAMAARGMYHSGAALKDLTRFNSGLASQEYGNAYNRLAGMAGIGQQAVQNTNANSTQMGNQMAGNIIQGGNARASGYIAQGNKNANGFNALSNLAGTALGAWAASDRRLKRHIVRIATHPSGLPWYAFEYVWGEASQGVMADEALLVCPQAVAVDASGYFIVNYGAL